ncbi:MAG TPA: MFS transporter [Solirubrobacterales bacterium]|jgi:hypothetical protein
MPQSPRWLVMQGGDDAARAVPAKIRVDDPDTIDREIAEIEVAIRLLDRAGRRTLLMIGVSGMVISLVALGGAFFGGGGSTAASVVAIVSLMTYVASFAISLGPICWKFVPETKGEPLEEIEAEFEARAAAHGAAPLPPGPVEPVG